MPWQQPLPPQEEEYNIFDDPFRWPFMKFPGLRPEDLFGCLHDRFNTTPISILDREAWHADVVDIICVSKTIEEFYAQLEERKMARLNELKAAIESVHSLKWSCWPNLPHYRLGRALQDLHLNASVFHAYQVFVAMSSFIDERLQEYNLARAKAISQTKRSLQGSSPTKEGQNSTSTIDASTDAADPSPAQSHSTAASYSGQASLGVNQTNRKRKHDETGGGTGRGKKPRATQPRSSLERDTNPEARQSSPSGNSPVVNDGKQEHIKRPEGTQNTRNSLPATSYPRPKDASKSTTVDQESLVQDTNQTQIESVAGMGEEIAVTVETSHSQHKMNSLDTANSPSEPTSHKPEVCETQYPRTRTDYEKLGWQRDYGPSGNILPNGENIDGGDALEVCRDPGKPTLRT